MRPSRMLHDPAGKTNTKVRETHRTAEAPPSVMCSQDEMTAQHPYAFFSFKSLKVASNPDPSSSTIIPILYGRLGGKTPTKRT